MKSIKIHNCTYRIIKNGLGKYIIQRNLKNDEILWENVDSFNNAPNAVNNLKKLYDDEQDKMLSMQIIEIIDLW